ncbi:ECF-type sigma factor, partial [Singulisphaera rosea]
MSSSSRSITLCIDMLKRGERAAAEKLWDAYMRRLIGLARARIGGTTRRAADEEDVA